MKKKNITICLNEEAIEKLRIISRQEKRSMSSAVEIMIENKNSMIGAPSRNWSRNRAAEKLAHIPEPYTMWTEADLRLLNVIFYMPDKFKDIVFFEHPEHPDLDIGIKQHWIGYKGDPNLFPMTYHAFLSQEMRDNIIVSEVPLNSKDFFMVVQIGERMLMHMIYVRSGKRAEDGTVFSEIFKERLTKLNEFKAAGKLV